MKKIELYLLVDHSSSTAAFIDKINTSIKNMIEKLKEEHKNEFGSLYGYDVDFVFIPFNHNYKIFGPTPIDDVEISNLVADGATNIGEPIIKAIDMALEHYHKFKEEAIMRASHPIIFLFTDGGADTENDCTAEEQRRFDYIFDLAAERIKENEGKKLSFVACSFQGQGADSETYKRNTEKIKKLTSFDNRVIEFSSGKDGEKINADPLSELIEILIFNLLLSPGPPPCDNILRDGVCIKDFTKD